MANFYGPQNNVDNRTTVTAVCDAIVGYITDLLNQRSIDGRDAEFIKYNEIIGMVANNIIISNQSLHTERVLNYSDIAKGVQEYLKLLRSFVEYCNGSYPTSAQEFSKFIQDFTSNNLPRNNSFNFNQNYGGGQFQNNFQQPQTFGAMGSMTGKRFIVQDPTSNYGGNNRINPSPYPQNQSYFQQPQHPQQSFNYGAPQYQQQQQYQQPQFQQPQPRLSNSFFGNNDSPNMRPSVGQAPVQQSQYASPIFAAPQPSQPVQNNVIDPTPKISRSTTFRADDKFMESYKEKMKALQAPSLKVNQIDTLNDKTSGTVVRQVGVNVGTVGTAPQEIYSRIDDISTVEELHAKTDYDDTTPLGIDVRTTELVTANIPYEEYIGLCDLIISKGKSPDEDKERLSKLGMNVEVNYLSALADIGEVLIETSSTNRDRFAGLLVDRFSKCMKRLLGDTTYEHSKNYEGFKKIIKELDVSTELREYKLKIVSDLINLIYNYKEYAIDPKNMDTIGSIIQATGVEFNIGEFNKFDVVKFIEIVEENDVSTLKLKTEYFDKVSQYTVLRLPLNIVYYKMFNKNNSPSVKEFEFVLNNDKASLALLPKELKECNEDQLDMLPIRQQDLIAVVKNVFKKKEALWSETSIVFYTGESNILIRYDIEDRADGSILLTNKSILSKVSKV